MRIIALKNKRQRVAKSSPKKSSPPKVKEPSFDKEKFCNHEAQETYSRIKSRPFIREKGVLMDKLDEANQWRVITMHWRTFIKPPSISYDNLVKEFYANLGNPKEDCVYVRSIWVPMNPNAINDHLKMELEDYDTWTIFKNPSIPMERIEEELCGKEVKWNIKKVTKRKIHSLEVS